MSEFKECGHATLGLSFIEGERAETSRRNTFHSSSKSHDSVRRSAMSRI